MLEATLVVVTAAVLILPVFRRGAAGRTAGVVVAVVSVVVHVAVEGARWQMVGAYTVVAVLAGWRSARLRSAPVLSARRWPARAGRTLGLFVVVASTVLAAGLPVPDLPDPTGPLTVATTSWTLVDASRDDPYDGLDGRARRLVAQAWYPTEDEGAPAPWVADAAAFSAALAPQIDLPSFALRHLDLVATNAVQDAPIGRGAWPLVVYSHGWRGFRTIQSDLAENLASHGYVVVSLDHTYGASATLFPHRSGGSVPLNPDALPFVSQVGQAAHDRAATLLLATFAQDVAFLLDRIEAGDVPAVLGENVRPDGVGMVGHSAGGGAVVRLCAVDDRCGAILGLDPWVAPIPPELLTAGLDQPILSIRSEDWQGNDNDPALHRLHDRSAASEGLAVVPGALHGDFTLLPFLTPLTRVLGLSGDVDVTRLHRAVDQVALDFFGRHLASPTRQGDQVVLPQPLRRDR